MNCSGPPVLRPAISADGAVALSWTPEEAALRRWSGPSTRWPATPDSLWQDIHQGGGTTFALEFKSGELVGFGQVRFREQAYGHLARIIVSPRHRGQGHGRTLCTALMREAVRLHPIRAFSLYVFPDNTSAIALYRSLGFVERGLDPRFNCELMEAPLTALPPP